MANSWRPEVIADDTGKWVGNSLRFATKEEAEGNVADLYARWAAVKQTRVVESEDPVNSVWPTVDRPASAPLNALRHAVNRALATGQAPIVNQEPLPRTGGLEVTPITDVDAFLADLTGRPDVPK